MLVGKLRLNTNIVDFIRSNEEFGEDVKTFLIESLVQELKPYKTDYKHYFKDYDDILNNYIEK